MPKTKITQSPFPASFRLIAERDLKRVEQQLSQRLKVVKRQRAVLRKATAEAKKAKWPKEDDHSTHEENSLTPDDRDVNSRRLVTVAQLEWLQTVGGVAWQSGDDEPLIESLHQMGFTGVAHAMQRIVDRRIDPANPADEEAVLLELQELIRALRLDLDAGIPHQQIPGFGTPPDRNRHRQDQMCGEVRRRTEGSTDANKWHCTSESPPEEFGHGPLTGTKKQLAKWCLPGSSAQDRRTLDRRVDRGIFWGRMDGARSFSIWFTNSLRFAEANQERLRDSPAE